MQKEKQETRERTELQTSEFLIKPKWGKLQYMTIKTDSIVRSEMMDNISQQYENNNLSGKLKSTPEGKSKEYIQYHF